MFRGTPPGGGRTLLEIVLSARDEEGREANLTFTLELGVGPTAEEPAADAPQAAVDLRSADTVDDGEKDPDSAETASADAGESGKETAEKEKPARVGAVPFNEQIRAAKGTRDPVLAKILAARDDPRIRR